MNLNLDAFKRVDNPCPPHPALTAVERVEGAVEDLVPAPQSTNADLPDLQAKQLFC